MMERGSADTPSGSNGEGRSSESQTYFVVAVDQDHTDLRVAASGELDAASALELAATFVREGRPGRPVSLDLQGLTFIDSAGVRVIVSELRRHADSATPFTITAASDPVRRIFEMTGLTKLLAACP